MTPIDELAEELKRWFHSAKEIDHDWIDFKNEAETILHKLSAHESAKPKAGEECDHSFTRSTPDGTRCQLCGAFKPRHDKNATLLPQPKAGEEVRLVAMGMALQDYRDNGLESLVPRDEYDYAAKYWERYSSSAARLITTVGDGDAAIAAMPQQPNHLRDLTKKEQHPMVGEAGLYVAINKALDSCQFNDGFMRGKETCCEILATAIRPYLRPAPEQPAVDLEAGARAIAAIRYPRAAAITPQSIEFTKACAKAWGLKVKEG